MIFKDLDKRIDELGIDDSILDSAITEMQKKFNANIESNKQLCIQLKAKDKWIKQLLNLIDNDELTSKLDE